MNEPKYINSRNQDATASHQCLFYFILFFSVFILKPLQDPGLHLGREDPRRAWRPPPVFSPGESRGRRSLAGCSLWGHRVGYGKWQPPPVFSPGESRGRRSLAGCSLWGHRVGYGKWQPPPVFSPGESRGRRSLAGCSPLMEEPGNSLSDSHFHFAEMRSPHGNS